MKKLLLLPLLAVFALFVSCSDDDDSNLPEVKSEVFFGNLLFNGSSVAEDLKCGREFSIRSCFSDGEPKIQSNRIKLPAPKPIPTKRRFKIWITR